MDQGVIEKTKKLYKSLLLRNLLMNSNEEPENVFLKAKKTTVRDSGYLIATAWDQITPDNIKRAWNKLLKNQDWGSIKEAGKLDVEEFLLQIKRIPGFHNCTSQLAKRWIEADYHDCGWEIYSPEEVLQR